MKKIDVNIEESYKLYKKQSTYTLEGDLIILSGVNGSGKSQLLQIIAKNGEEPISRSVNQTNDAGVADFLEDILLLSFRDNINLGNDFGQFSVTYKQNYANSAWEYYKNNIKHQNATFFDNQRTKDNVVFIVNYNDYTSNKTMFKNLKDFKFALIIDLSRTIVIDKKLAEIEGYDIFSYVIINGLKKEDHQLVENYIIKGKEMFMNELNMM